MAFFKKVLKKMGGKWHPQAVTVGKPVTTKEVADCLSQISTVSRADVYAVLTDLAGVLADYMAQGRSVKIDGLVLSTTPVPLTAMELTRQIR